MTQGLIERDWRSICDIIYCVNSCDSLEEFESVVSQRLFTFIPCNQATLFAGASQKNGLPTYDRVKIIGAPAHYMEKFMEGGYGIDPYLRGFGQPYNSRAFRDSDLLPEDFRMDTPLYKDIYEPQGIHYALRSFFPYNGKIVGNISLFNTKEEGDFMDRDVEVLNILCPHIALKLGRLLVTDSREQVVQRRADVLGRFGLTAREREIVRCVLSNTNDAEVAEYLSISPKTLKRHLHNIYTKTGVESRTQLYSLIYDL